MRFEMAIGRSIYCATGTAERAGRAAFTLVESMIVVAVIGTVAALALPSMVSSRKLSEGRRIVHDAGELNGAITEWAMEKNKQDGDTIDTVEAATYLKSTWPRRDLMGYNFKIGTVGTNQITIAKQTKVALAGAGIDWGPY